MQSRCARAEGAGGHRAGHNAQPAPKPDAQQQAAAPLTAEFQEAPETHNGVDSFTVRIGSSESISTSYNTIRDHPLEADGGKGRRASRVDGRSDLWEIAITPDSDDAVSVVLPTTENCGDQGAVCTGDGRMLSNGLGVIVSGPQEEENWQLQPEPENAPTTGASVGGEARTGQTLTADVSGIADADGLDNATFNYQWLADDADIEGATGPGYTPASADASMAIKVRVSFSDDRGNEEELTSAATAAVASLPSLPLTASLENVATSHGGQNVFTFELRFSEEFRLNYKTLRDHAFTVAGGAVENAGRITKGSNLRWLITVRPDGDGGMLSNRLEFTVSGPQQ